MNKIQSEDVSDVLKTTDYIINKFGPRLPGSKACIEAAGEIKKEYEKYCDKVFENNFIQYPGTFFYIPSIFALSYLLGTIFLFTELTFISIVLYISGITYLLIQFVLFGDTFDGLSKKATGKNVFGIIDQGGELKQQIIISAHHDSPYICNFLSGNQMFYPFRLFAPLMFYLYTLITSIIFFLTDAGNENSAFNLFSIIIACAGFLFIVPLFWYNSKKGSPGAGDNLLSSVIGIKIAEIIKKNLGALKNTRIIILSNDGEEIGQRGAKAFVKQNKNLLDECKTYIINMDCIYKYKDLAFMISDRNATIKLSEKLTDEIINISDKIGYCIRKKKFPFGGGGTDAAQFARAGFESVSMIGISTNMIRTGLYYHTANDTVDNLETDAVEAVLNIVLNFIVYKDGCCLPD